MQLRQPQLPVQFAVSFMRRRPHRQQSHHVDTRRRQCFGSVRREAFVPLAVSEQAHREWSRLVQSTSHQVSGRGRRYAAPRTRSAEARGMTFLARSIAACIRRFSWASGTRSRLSQNPESRSRTRTRRSTAISIDTRHSSLATRSRCSASVSPSSSRTTTSPSPR